MNPLSVPTLPHALSEVYRTMRPEMERVADLIRERLTHDQPALNEIVEYSVHLGGKRLRPLLTLLSGKLFGKLRPEHFDVAAAIEMIHTGTLIHDDVLDGANFRRHLETLHIRWDIKTAILTGDYLLTEAITLVTRTGDANCYDWIADACRRTCEGELLQTTAAGDFALSLDEYMRSIGGKTASLLECSCRLGAYFAGSGRESTERLARFGHLLGLAFQILDDLLDLVGDAQTTGKTLGTDLANQKTTLPLILFLRHADAQMRSEMLEWLQKPNFGLAEQENVRSILKRSGALEQARQTAAHLVDEALALLREIEIGKAPSQAAAQNALETVARFVLERNQ